jgi:c-di-GMP-binding flagellar brake protein YcgR
MTPDPNEFASHTLKGKNEILEKLRMMEKQQTLLTATAAGNQSGFLTTIIKVLPDKDLLAIDTSANESLNRTLIDAESVEVYGRVDGVYTRFTVKGLRSAVLNGRGVLAVPLPDALYWLQRRRYYRVTVPYSMPLKCQIPTALDPVAEFEVLNLCLEGLAIQAKTGQLDASIEIGSVLEGCALLPNLSTEHFALEVRYVLPTTTGLTERPALQLGFSLHGYSRAFEVQLQKLLFELEMHKKRAENLVK